MKKVLTAIKDMEGKTIEATIKCSCCFYEDEPRIIKFTDGTVIRLDVKHGDEVVADDTELDLCCRLSAGIISQTEHAQLTEDRRKRFEAAFDTDERKTYERLKAKYEK